MHVKINFVYYIDIMLQHKNIYAAVLECSITLYLRRASSTRGRTRIQYFPRKPYT